MWHHDGPGYRSDGQLAVLLDFSGASDAQLACKANHSVNGSADGRQRSGLPLNLFAVGENPNDGADARLLEDLLMPEQQVSAAALGGILESAVNILHEDVSLVRIEFLDR